MTDVRTLLRSASPPPLPTVGIERVLDAARERQRNRRRRFLVWTTGVLVLGVGGPVSGALVNSSQAPTRVETARPVPEDVDMPATTVIDAVGRSSLASRERATKQIATAPKETASAAHSEPPRAGTDEGCREDRRSTSNVQLSENGQGGGGWDEYPSCSYTATVAGGYAAKGSWRIDVTRAGVTFVIESARSPACGRNVIQPGDEVTAYLRKGVNSPSDWFIAVGSNEGC
jgi:hypothetical protein